MTQDVIGKKMVVGFMFQGPRVLLVRKTHPDWQAGLLNGVGGVIENDETPLGAMIREFGEETGFLEKQVDWRHYATEIEPFGAYVYFFTTRIQFTAHAWPTMNDAKEELSWVNTNDLPFLRKLGNLNWLVPLALDPRSLEPVIVTARGDIRGRATW